MRLSISTVCWAGLGRREALRKARGAGFTHVELIAMAPETALFHGHSLRTESAEAMKADFDELGLRCSGLHIGGLSTGPDLPGLVGYAHAAIDAAATLGADVLVIGGPSRSGERFRPYAEALEGLIPHLRGRGVRLAVENHHGNWMQYAQDYEHLFDRIDDPFIGMTLDTGHFALSGVDPKLVAKAFGRRVFNVHVKDHAGHESVELGMGTVDIRGCVSTLRDTGYGGFLTQELELSNHGGDAGRVDRAAARGLSYMEALLGR